MAYHPSPELDSLIEALLGSEKKRFFESTAEQLPHTFRFNDLKAPPTLLKSFLEEQQFEFSPFPGFEDVFRMIRQPFPIGKSLSHFLGHIYVQDIASMLPPKVLSPQPDELVLDMSAAPGSKTTQMAVLMKNRGMILANDVVTKRLRALLNNLQRMGIVNTAVIKTYGESLGNQYFEVFDKVLLDPACSGLGTLHKSPEVLSWWTPNHCIRLAASQKSLVHSAVKALKPGGILLYSTCTLTPEENEEVVDDALKRLPIKLLPFELPELVTHPGLRRFKDRIYDDSMEYCRRIYPFENQTEGFFLAKFQKQDAMEIPPKKPAKPFVPGFITHTTSPVKKYLDFFAFQFDIPRDSFAGFNYQIRNEITAVTSRLAEFNFQTKPLKTGLNFAHPMKQIAKLTTEGVHLFASEISKNRLDISDLSLLEKFVNRESLHLSIDTRNQTVVSYRGIPVGYGLEDQGKLKSQFPKAGWPFVFKTD